MFVPAARHCIWHTSYSLHAVQVALEKVENKNMFHLGTLQRTQHPCNGHTEPQIFLRWRPDPNQSRSTEQRGGGGSLYAPTISPRRPLRLSLPCPALAWLNGLSPSLMQSDGRLGMESAATISDGQWRKAKGKRERRLRLPTVFHKKQKGDKLFQVSNWAQDCIANSAVGLQLFGLCSPLTSKVKFPLVLRLRRSRSRSQVATNNLP